MVRRFGLPPRHQRRKTRNTPGWRAGTERGGGRTAQKCPHWLDLSLAAVFVFGGLYEPVVCLVEISPYRIDIGDDRRIVWIFSLDHGRGIPRLDDGALRSSQVRVICAQRDLRRSRRGHDSLANQHATGKNSRGNDRSQNHFASCHGKTSCGDFNRSRQRAGKGKMRKQR